MTPYTRQLSRRGTTLGASDTCGSRLSSQGPGGPQDWQLVAEGISMTSPVLLPWEPMTLGQQKSLCAQVEAAA